MPRVPVKLFPPARVGYPTPNFLVAGGVRFTDVNAVPVATKRVRAVAAGTDTVLSASTSGGDLTINLATDGAGAVTSTVAPLAIANGASVFARAAGPSTATASAFAFMALAGGSGWVLGR